MFEEKRRIFTRTIPFLLVGLMLLVLYLHFFVGFSNMVEAFGKVDLKIFSLAFLVALLETVFFTFTWYYLLRVLSVRISFPRAFSYVLIGIFVDILVPAESVSAEISKIYLMNKDGKDVGKVTATLVVQRIFGMIIMVLSLIIGCITLFILNYPLPSLVVYLTLTTTVLTIIFLSLLIILCVKQDLTEKVLRKILGFVNRISYGHLNVEKWEKNIKKGLNSFYLSLSFLSKHPKKMIISIFTAVFSWILYLAVSELVFYSLNYYVPFVIVTIVYSLSIIVQSTPGIPAEVGVTEIVMSSLYGMFGVPLGISAVATVLIRLLNVWLKFILGFIALQWIGIKIMVKNSLAETDK